jgi:ATP-binding cassette subfamily B protein
MFHVGLNIHSSRISLCVLTEIGQVAHRSGDGRITLLVSHRFSTVRMADFIVVLDGARVAEVGTHDHLMAWGGAYAELYGIQAAAYR